MKKEIEHNVERTLQSIEGIKRAEANPYLFEKIKTKLEPVQPRNAKVKLSWVIACGLVLTINSGSIFYYLQKSKTEKTETAYSTIGNELGLNQTYNY